ncbi:hypothetical protein EJB05_32000, partial [Eragrostis curvula]
MERTVFLRCMEGCNFYPEYCTSLWNCLSWFPSTTSEPCLGAELHMFDSNPVNRSRMSVEPGFQLSLTLCMEWKRVLDRTTIRLMKLYCILGASSESCVDRGGPRIWTMGIQNL